MDFFTSKHEGAFIAFAYAATTGLSTARKTSSFIPKRICCPSESTRTWSTAARALGRWAITITIAPRSSHRPDRVRKRALALFVEVRVRLVQNDEKRIAIQSARQALHAAVGRLKAPTPPHQSEFRNLVAERRQDRGRRLPAPRRAPSRNRSLDQTGRCFRLPCLRTTRRPVADSPRADPGCLPTTDPMWHRPT